MANINIEKSFGQRIKAIRKSLGLSQEQLSFKTGLHRNYICDVERGKRNVSLKAIEQFANGLEVDITDLFRKEN